MSPKVDFTLGLSASFGSSDYMETYFGVDAEDSFRSRLPRFNANSGMRDFSITPGLVYHLNKSWHLGAGVRYMRLIGDAEDSPVVEVGDENQWMAGLGVFYSW